MDIYDFTYAYTLNIVGTLVNKSLDKERSVLLIYSKNLVDDHHKNFSIDNIERVFNNSEECRLCGSFEVMKLPRKFSYSFTYFLTDS